MRAGRNAPAPATLLFQFLRDRQDRAEAVSDLTSPAPFAHADPYLLASAMQKAIRRSDLTTARRSGHQLYALDRQRLWRRLAVVALEDIGMADIAAVAELIAISALTEARRSLNGDAFALDHALTLACSAIKDRSGDQLGSIVGREPPSDEDRAALRLASLSALLAMVADARLPCTRRLRAAALASGRCDGPVHPGAHVVAVLDVLHELGVPPLLIKACEVYAARQRDLLPVLVPFADALRAPGCTSMVVSHDLGSPELIEDWPCYAFDPLWTRTGKRAVELWLRSYWMKPPWLPRQVAAALWNVESAACDRTLAWSVSNQLRERAHRADLLARGVPLDRHVELTAWVIRERPALLTAREAVWKSTIRQSGGPVETLEQAILPLPVPRKRERQ